MPKRIFFIVLLIIAFFISAASARAQVLERMLPNGIKVIVVEDRKAPIATLQIWYRVGAMDEDSSLAGISHLLEHMMFKGTGKTGPSEFSRTIQKNGGTDNAFTSRDYTMYFETLSSDRLWLAVELEADRMQNLLLAEKEVLSERDVVMEERRLRYDDDPQSSLYEEVMAAAFKVHPYGFPIIGWMSTLSNITPEALRRHYREHYSPANAFIVVAGDVEPEEAVKLIGKHFGGIKKPAAAGKRIPPQEPPQSGQRRVYLRKEAELPYVLGVYHAPNLLDPDGFALEVLSAILSEGKSARLYRSLVYEKRVALSAFADYNPLSRAPFVFDVGGTPAPGHTAQELEEAIYAEVEAIKQDPPDEFELQKAKNQLEASFLMGQDSLFYQAYLTGQFEMLGDWRLKERYVEGIRKVTAEDVSRAAKKYLNEDNRTMGILIPIKKEAEEGEK